jgi:hypothetical protein
MTPPRRHLGFQRAGFERRTAMIALFLIGAMATSLPSLDISRGCRPESQEMGQITDYSSCMQDEQSTRQKLAREWSSYPAGARDDCLRDRDSLLNSYVELLTCIEMQTWKSDLGSLTASGGAVTGGAGGGSPPTPGQLGGSGSLHPLGGSPAIHIH